MKIRYPEYGNCIANLACSILKYYGAPAPNESLPAADKLLDREYKNVVFILLDGFGVSSMKEHLSEDSYIRKNFVTDYSSTYPPTTVAAETAAESGLYPNQSGWLGWTGYFPDIDKSVVYFFNKDAETGEDAADFYVPGKFVPFTNIRELIAKTGVDTHFLAPFAEPYPKSFSEVCRDIEKKCESDGKQFIYAYWDEPDDSMHHTGVVSKKVHDIIIDIDKCIQELSEKLRDTIIFITADHGHINVKNIQIDEHPEITDCFIRKPTMEARAMNLFIKEDMMEKFEKAFKKYYSDGYILLSREEVLKSKLLGTGENHQYLLKLLGDYLAVAVDEYELIDYSDGFKGNHAGLTEDEMRIPLICIKC